MTFGTPASRPPTITSTAAAWLLAFSPLWMAIVEIVVELVAPPRGPLWVGMSVFLLLASAALAISDRKQLLLGGQSTAASAWWWLLSPLAYLIARAVVMGRYTGGGAGPAIAHGILLGLGAVGWVALVVLLAVLP